MKASYEEQSYNLQCQIDEKKAASADYENEIAYAQQQATDYANLLAEQTAELQRLEAERIAAEEEARRQAEAEAAARAQAEAEEEARRQAEAEAAQQDEADESEDVQYDEDGDVIENTDEDTAEDDTEYVDDTYDENEDVQYDEDGNVISDDQSGYTDTTEDNTDANYDDSSDTSEDTSSDSGSSSSYSGSGSSVVDYATQFVGNPYVWGGTSLTNGADCSGFVQSVYANFGVSLPRTSYEQQNAGTEVSYADAQPGDLICYGGHVAIYMGNGQIVHASNSRDGIKISNDATYRTILLSLIHI